MPVTVAHPAAVLALRRSGLPMAALVVGSMVPDVPVFTGDWGFYQVTHSLRGVCTYDLAFTVALVALWDLVLRDALVDLSPGVVRDRLPARRRLGARAWLLVPVAAAVGSLTHIVWDDFTHRGRWGVRHIAWLAEQHGRLLGLSWAQYLSSILGTGLICLVLLVRLAEAPRQDERPRRLPVGTLPAILLTGVLAGGLTGFVRAGAGLQQLAFHGTIGLIVGAAAALLLAALGWHAAPRPPIRPAGEGFANLAQHSRGWRNRQTR